MRNLFRRILQTSVILLAVCSIVLPVSVFAEDPGVFSPALSSDGRYVVVISTLADLVAEDNDENPDAVVFDRQTGTKELVSVNSLGQKSNRDVDNVSISGDGRYVVFESGATNLVPNDTNSAVDIFVFDRQTDTIERVSVSVGGTDANGFSQDPSISSNGRYVAFTSEASNLVSDDTNLVEDIFVYDRDTQTTRRVSVDALGGEANGGSSYPVISRSGVFVTFTSWADNLVPNDTNEVSDVFVYDIDDSSIERVSLDGNGVEANADSWDSGISDNGRYVVFLSSAELLPNDTNSTQDVFVLDRQTSELRRVTNALNGDASEFGGDTPIISPTGGRIAFISDSTDLDTIDTNGETDVFAYDMQSDTITRVAVDDMGNAVPGISLMPALSKDGCTIAFISTAVDDLGDGLANNPGKWVDVYIRSLCPPLTFTLSFDSQGGSAVADMTGLVAGNTVSLPAAPTRSGYTFLRWNTASDNSGTAYGAGSSYLVSAVDTTLYAIWQQNSSGGNTTSRSRVVGGYDPVQRAAYEAQQQTAVSGSDTPLGSGACVSSLLITENLRVGSRTAQVSLLQQHINRILAAQYQEAAGPVDGIFGPLTKQGVVRLQTVLRDQLHLDLGPTGTDGIVGPFTRAAINNSCGI